MEYKTLRMTKPDDVIEIDKSKMIDVNDDFIDWTVSVRVTGEFNDRAINLDAGYDWVLGKDSEGLIVLVPLNKK